MKSLPLKSYLAGYEGAANLSDGNVRPFTAGTYALGFYDSGDIFTNDGAAGPVVFQLPAAKNGLNFMFDKAVTQNFTIQATGGAKINGSAANGTYANTAAETNKVVYIVSNGTDWKVISTNGTWVTT